MRGHSLLATALAFAAPALTGAVDREAAFGARVLAAHNRERDLIQVGALAWDAGLAAGAKAWADHLARTGTFEHSRGGEADQLGENLWAGTAGAYAPEEMIQLWINEKSDFVAGAFPHVSKSANPAAVGHYTQLIWRRTSKVGCAIASNAREDVLVCRYRISGNVIGERPI